ncbi:MAG: flagellar FlbD family protein [Candidatus Sericytochromatia bacterium]|nr:flagellar FlbD family protein [Candidatus Sericytochromatia bacterium]
MIRLTRLNDSPLYVNNDLVKTIEATPDTTLTLVSGEKLMVKEDIETVIAAIITYRRLLVPPVESRLEL